MGKLFAVPIYETRLERINTENSEYRELNTFDQASSFLHSYLDKKDREHLVVIMMTHRNQIIGVETVSIGTPMQSVLFVNSVIKPALLCNAQKIIIGHNHPMGDATEPTEGDIEFTMAAIRACQLVNIELMDHIVVDDSNRNLSLLAVVTELASAEVDLG